MKRTVFNKTQLNTSKYLVEGEPLITKLKRLKEGGSGIEQITENVYSGEYQPASNIRLDKWNVALDAMIARDKKTAKDIMEKKALDETVAMEQQTEKQTV